MRWNPSEVDQLVHQFFASPFGMAQHDHDRRELLAEVLENLLRTTGDPTRWDGPIVTSLLIAEMPHQPHLPGRDRRQLPDLLRGFIGFCMAEWDLCPDDADDALAMVTHWSEDWNRPALPRFDPWSTERRVLDQLRVEVGTAELLRSLDVVPLTDEPVDASALAPEASQAVDDVLRLIDRACGLWADPEVRIAARRLAARVANGDAAVLADQPNRAASAAVLVWLVARGSGCFGPRRARVKDLMATLGLAQASPSSWAAPYLRAAGLRSYGHRHQVTLGPELLTSAHRRSIIERRDHCQRVIGTTSGPDVLQIAHDSSGDPRAPAARQRAHPPGGAR